MYKRHKIRKGKIKGLPRVEGETIEIKMMRIKENKERITDGAEPIYTERKDGVRPELDIRTDKFEVATDAADKATANYRLKRQNLQQAAGTAGDPQEQG